MMEVARELGVDSAINFEVMADLHRRVKGCEYQKVRQIAAFDGQQPIIERAPVDLLGPPL